MKLEIIKTEKVTYNETDNAIMDMVAEQLSVGRDKVNYKSNFVTDLGADSLDIVELIMAFEELLDCEVPDEEAEKFTTVKDSLMYADKNDLSI